MAALQFQEVGAAGFLVWIAIHVPNAAPVLVGAAVVLVAWAAIADAPLGIFPVTGLAVHQRGLIVIGAAIGTAPVLTGQLANLVVVLPCLLVAGLLIRNGLVRWNTAVTTGADQVGPKPEAMHTRAAVAGTALPDGTRDAIRRAGRVAGRASTVVARQADVAVPAGARAAGKAVGRFRRAPKR